MNDLIAGEALSSTTVRVPAESRIVDMLDAIEHSRATHVVVVDGELVTGVISLNTAHISNTHRIFADLTSGSLIPEITQREPLEEVARKMEEGGTDAVRVLSDNGEFLGIVTQTSLLHASLEAANKRLEEVRRLRGQQERLRILGQMVCGMAHDLNNLMAPIIAGLEMIQIRSDNPLAIRRNADVMLKAAQDTANVVKRLQDFYRGHDSTDLTDRVSLSRVAEETRDLTRVKWRDESLHCDRYIELELDLADVPPVEISQSAIREVLVNLIFNAVDAIEKNGRIVVKTREDNGWVVAEVSDTGRGMSAEDRRRCFEPFFTTKGERGTGLGLSVSRELVTDYGGRIEVISNPGEGATFRVSFPASSVRPHRSTTTICP